MKTDSKTIAGLLATVIWAGNEYGEAEQAAVEEVGEALEINPDILHAEVSKTVEKLNKLDEAGVDAFLKKTGGAVNKGETHFALESALQVAISDNVLAHDEVETIHAIGEAMGMTPTEVTLLVADLVKSEPELDVDVTSE